MNIKVIVWKEAKKVKVMMVLRTQRASACEAKTLKRGKGQVNLETCLRIFYRLLKTHEGGLHQIWGNSEHFWFFLKFLVSYGASLGEKIYIFGFISACTSCSPNFKWFGVGLTPQKVKQPHFFHLSATVLGMALCKWKSRYFWIFD